MSGKLYEVLASEDYDPSLEEWEFPPGAIVECEMKIDNGEKFLQAMREISREQPPQPQHAVIARAFFLW